MLCNSRWKICYPQPREKKPRTEKASAVHLPLENERVNQHMPRHTNDDSRQVEFDKNVNITLARMSFPDAVLLISTKMKSCCANSDFFF